MENFSLWLVVAPPGSLASAVIPVLPGYFLQGWKYGGTCGAAPFCKQKHTVGDVLNRFSSQRFSVCCDLYSTFIFDVYIFVFCFFITLPAATARTHLHLFHPIILVNRPVPTAPPLNRSTVPRHAICQVLLPTLARGFFVITQPLEWSLEWSGAWSVEWSMLDSVSCGVEWDF